MTETCLDKMTWEEVKERLKESDIAIVMVAAIEAHGTHLPLETDLLEVHEITRRAVEKVAEEVKPVVAPPLPYGISEALMKFPGTISLREETLRMLLRDVCESLIRHGFRKIVIMDGHGGNPSAVSTVMNELAEETGALLVAVDWWGGLGGDIIEENTETHMLFHAGEAETSVAWACGARVREEKLESAMPKSPSKFIKFNLYAGYPHVSVGFGGRFSLDKLSKTSAVGDPTKASKEKGERIVSIVVDRLAEFLRELKKL